MQDYYARIRPNDKYVYRTAGAHIALNGPHPQSGIVLLNLEYCVASIVSHEFMHAVFWAWKHSANKRQHPITIRSMGDEERLLYSLTDAVKAFYGWYLKVVDEKRNRLKPIL
jgi:hypothetical protein